MPIVDGKKMACENCIRGHRSAVCPHQYRPLFEVRSRGRPKGCTIDKETGKWTKPTAKQPRKSRCCGEAGCHCVVIDNDIIEKRDCQGCPPGLAQRPLELPKDLNVPEAVAGSSAQAAAAPSSAYSFDVEFDCSCEGGCSCAGCSKHTSSEASSGAPSGASPAPASCCASKKAAPQATALAQGAVKEPSCSSCLPCVIAPFDGPPAPRAPTFASARDLATFHRNHFDNEERRAWFREQIEQASGANNGSSSGGSSNDLAPTTTAPTQASGGEAAANADVTWGERLPGETDEAWQRRLGFNYLTPDSVRIFDAAREFREERQKLREREEAEEEDNDEDDDDLEAPPPQAASAAKSTGSGSNVVAGGQDDLEALRLRALSGRRNKKARTEE